MYLCHASWPNEILYRPEIWYMYTNAPYLKTSFFFFEKMTLMAASSEKLSCHMDFSQISIALFSFISNVIITLKLMVAIFCKYFA